MQIRTPKGCPEANPKDAFLRGVRFGGSQTPDRSKEQFVKLHFHFVGVLLWGGMIIDCIGYHSLIKNYKNIRVYDEEATDLLKYLDSTYKFIREAKEQGGAVLGMYDIYNYKKNGLLVKFPITLPNKYQTRFFSFSALQNGY